MGFAEEVALPAYMALVDFVLGSVFFALLLGYFITRTSERRGTNVWYAVVPAALEALRQVLAPVR